MNRKDDMTPDREARFQRESRLDKPPHGELGRNNAAEIDHNREGPHHHLDGPATSHGRSGGHLGTGSDSLADAARSIPNGAEAPKVDWGHVKRGGGRPG